MGIPFGAYELLMKHKYTMAPKRQAGVETKCLMFGRAKMTLSPEQKELVSRRRDVSPALLSGWADGFLSNYGFDWVGSLDYSDFEGAGYTWNLNQPLVTPSGPIVEALQSIDLILDYGTSEHVFNPGVAYWNATTLLKQGGFLNSMLPVLGFCDHGIYQFSPSFFYAVQRPELQLEALYFFVHNMQASPPMIWDGLSPEFREHVPGAFDGSFAANCLQYLNQPVLAWALYRKVGEVKHDDFMCNTQQPVYRAQWSGQFKVGEADADKLAMYGLSGQARAEKLTDYVKSIALPAVY
jgi:hypothetical protein